MADGQLLHLVELVDGAALLTNYGTILISDMIKAHFAISKIADGAHIEKTNGDMTRFSFDAGPEVYDILTGWGAETENDEESDPLEPEPDGEDDARDLPKTLPPFEAEAGDARPLVFPPIPWSVMPEAMSALLAERLAQRRETAIAA